MWAYAVLFTMAALTGMYMTGNKELVAATEQAAANNLAASMATYRAVVVDYFSLHPGNFNNVSLYTLKSEGLLPQWSKLYTEPQTSPWSNYRDSSGLIYIYAASPTAINITAEITRLSRNSILTGVFRTGDVTLYSPVLGETQIPLPSAASISIPDGSPLWIAMLK